MQHLFFRRLLVVPLCVFILLSFIVSPYVAFADSSTASVSPNQGPAGTQVTGTGSSWRAGDQMQVSWADDGSILANTTVQSNGTFTVSFKIPTSGQGAHYIYFTDLSSRYFIPAEFTITTIDLQTVNIQSLQPLLAGSNPTFRANIRNNGSGASGNFNIRWIADGKMNFDGSDPSLAPGASTTHDHIWNQRGMGNLTPGQHTLTFIANFDHRITETNYDNNQFTLTFTVNPRDSVSSNPYPDSSQCTWFAEEKMHGATGLWMPNFGDAHSWRDNAPPHGWIVGSTPETASVIVMQYANGYQYSYWDPSTNTWKKTSISTVGHVGWVDDIGCNGSCVHVVDRNWDTHGSDGERWFLISDAPVNFVYSSH